MSRSDSSFPRTTVLKSGLLHVSKLMELRDVLRGMVFALAFSADPSPSSEFAKDDCFDAMLHIDWKILRINKFAVSRLEISRIARSDN